VNALPNGAAAIAVSVKMLVRTTLLIKTIRFVHIVDLLSICGGCEKGFSHQQDWYS
jgi:hypothetical protein